jgi:hypothetical protein
MIFEQSQRGDNKISGRIDPSWLSLSQRKEKTRYQTFDKQILSV